MPDGNGNPDQIHNSYLPFVGAGKSTTRRIVVDPLTRIEGHLRIEAQVTDGYVGEAWSTGTMFRGIELILQGRDPREAWAFTQRICGVCTTVHTLGSVRAVENALGVEPPANARLVRNLIEGIQFVHDHVIHFYHLHGPDWVDVVSALQADPIATSQLARSLSDWPNSSPEYFSQTKSRLQGVVSSGQLGIFANGYWGHPSYRLPPEANLMVLAHYLEALGWQREVIRVHAYLGGKNPHPQTYLVGGMATSMAPNNHAAINQATLNSLRQLAATAYDFVARVYLPDLLALAAAYPEWAALGAGPKNFLAYGDFPSNSATDNWLPAGVVLGGRLDAWVPFDQSLVQEEVARSWYVNNGPRHPFQGETLPQYTGPALPYQYMTTDSQYSWLKAPRYQGTVMEVGPLARMAVAYAAGHVRVRQLIDAALSKLGWGQPALFSTMGRILARGIETVAIAEQLAGWIDQLEANLNAGNLAVFNGARWDPSTWPAEAMGFGTTEAPARGPGALGAHPQRPDRQLPDCRAVHLERLAARRGQPAGCLGTGACRHADGQPRAAPGDLADDPLLRSLHGLRRPCARRHTAPHASSTGPLSEPNIREETLSHAPVRNTPSRSGL